MYKWLLICSQTCTWIANNADCTNKTHIAGAAVMMPLFLQTPTSSPLSSSLLWSIGYSEIVGSNGGVYLKTFFLHHAELNINHSQLRGHESTKLRVEQGPCEPMSAWESQTRERTKLSQSEPECARVSQNVREWARESKLQWCIRAC